MATSKADEYRAKAREAEQLAARTNDSVIKELHAYLLESGTKFSETQFQQDHDWIRRYLAKEMYIHAFNVDESDRVFARTDPEVERAVESMPKASALVQNVKKVVVQRTQPQAVGAAAH